MVVYIIEIILTGIMLLKKEGLQMDLIPGKTMFLTKAHLTKLGVHFQLINRLITDLIAVIIILLSEITQTVILTNHEELIQEIHLLETLHLQEVITVTHQKFTNLTEEIIN